MVFALPTIGTQFYTLMGWAKFRSDAKAFGNEWLNIKRGYSVPRTLGIVARWVDFFMLWPDISWVV